MRGFADRLRPIAWLIVGILVVDLLVILAQVDAAIGSAACVERANFELILCLAPPTPVEFAASVGSAIGLSVLLGAVIGRRRA